MMLTQPLTSTAPQPGAAEPRTLIATTQPQLFMRALAPKVNRSIFLYERGADAIEALTTEGCTAFYADFRQLEDRWTGQRFLRYIREHEQFASVEFWLMAENWYPSQEEWAVKCGAAGMVKRSAKVLASRLMGGASQLSIALELQLDAIDETFIHFAGPLGAMHCQATREAIEASRIDASREAYVQDLLARFPLGERRDDFLNTLWADVELDFHVETTQPGDPWMTEVNNVFRRYAGALGARIIISRTLDTLERHNKHERSFYVSELSAGLTNPARRADFLSAAREARLIT